VSFVILKLLVSTGMGALLLASTIPKLRHPKGFVLAVLEYRVLPPLVSRFYARLVPPLELLLALLFLTGTAVRSAAVVTSLLLLTFVVAISVNVARGRDLDCHCFGTAAMQPIGWRLLLQDSVLLCVAAVVAASTTAFLEPEPWSVFRLSGMVQPGSLWPLLACAAVTAFTAALLSRSFIRGRRYGRGLTSR
jgi:putative oxidoreductase